MSKKEKTLKQVFNEFPTVVRLFDGSKPLFEGDKAEKQLIYPGCLWQNRPTIIIQWAEKGRGFGEYVFYQEDGKLYCKNECDSKETVKRIMTHMVDQAIFTEPRREKKCKSKVKSNSKSKSQTKK